MKNKSENHANFTNFADWNSLKELEIPVDELFECV